ncbi:DNA-methyltransferase [Nocardiopsis composta]|uniref:Methyltransferase n=1 Tax=Nocardiopsis composta TaxID=157465 RepID=A0A7W8VCU1_9ACTN|nr:site-specific DNA-methyltransferase [Nocardiopsis composta]MBB5431335.1 site-specific DNA-methyltransferase (adenine-specific) [Nocardiopsis composta]
MQTIHQGDALAILPALGAGTVDAVITDPPYNVSSPTAAAKGTASARSKYVSSDAQHTLPDFAGDNKDQRGYAYWLTLLLGASLHATRQGGSCLVFTDWSQLPATSDALQAAGWIWRGIVPWEKPATRPFKNGFRRACEYVLWGTHGEPHRHVPDIYLPGLLRGSQPRGNRRQHITQKPVEIMRELVKIAPEGGTVLDPCMGSGTTGVAALEEGRRFIGIEYTEHYAQVARDRLAAVQPALA